MAKGKKGKGQAAGNSNTQQMKTEEEQPQMSNKDTNAILEAITNLDLDNPDFIDVKAFDQSKAILVNALDDLEAHIRYFNKEEYDKFPKLAATSK